MSLRRLLRDERGQASAELMGMLWWLMIAALAVWQLMLGAWTVTQTSNAARTASRVSAREGADPRKAAREALSSPLRKGFVDRDFKLEGDTATVKVRIPIILPGLTADGFDAERSVTLPSGS
jgi:hypothetical protein